MNRWERLDNPCGTDRGYQTHRRRGTPPCRECRTAHAQWMARWRKNRQEAQT